MISTYYINVTQLEEEKIYEEKFRSLSPYRRQKIQILKHHKDKCRSLGAGIVLDCALQQYGLRERQMDYSVGQWGKPLFKEYPQLHFSLSHSGDYAICSIGKTPIGNDIEGIKGGHLKVADRFYTKKERDWMYEMNNEQEIEHRMFRIWTAKESFLKATGRGMSLSLLDFSILFGLQGAIEVEQTLEESSFHGKEYRQIPGYCVSVCCYQGEEIAPEMQEINLKSD